jgi:hypothetical protein
MAKGSRSFGGTRPAVCAKQGANGRVCTPEDALGMAGEPDTKKLVRPVRREAHRNLAWQQTKALCVHPIVGKAAKHEGMECEVPQVLHARKRLSLDWLNLTFQRPKQGPVAASLMRQHRTNTLLVGVWKEARVFDASKSSLR